MIVKSVCAIASPKEQVMNIPRSILAVVEMFIWDVWPDSGEMDRCLAPIAEAYAVPMLPSESYVMSKELIIISAVMTFSHRLKDRASQTMEIIEHMPEEKFRSPRHRH